MDKWRTMNTLLCAHMYTNLRWKHFMSIRACRILTENVNYRLAAFVQGKQLNLDKESRAIAF